MRNSKKRKTNQLNQAVHQQTTSSFSKHLINFKGQPVSEDGGPTGYRGCHHIDLEMSQQRISSLEIEDSSKDFMNLWNSYLIRKDIKIQRNLVRADKHDASIALMGFIAEHGEELRKKFMKHYFMHVLVLYEYGYLSLQTLVENVQRIAKSEDVLVKREMKDTRKI